MVSSAIPPGLCCTFVPVDPARGSWFALWDPANPEALVAPDVEGTRPDRVDLWVPTGPAGTAAPRRDSTAAPRRVAATVARLPMPTAIPLLAAVGAGDPVDQGLRVWAAVVRTALSLVGRGRLVPWVSPSGWDTWRVQPLDPHDRRQLAALAAALPPTAANVAIPASDAPATDVPDRVDPPSAMIEPEALVRLAVDAVGDRFVRVDAPDIAASPVFAGRDPIRVRHLRPWVRDLESRLGVGRTLTVQMHPPGDVDHWQAVFRVRSRRDPSLTLDAEELWRSGGRAPGFGLEAEIDLLAGIRRAAAACPHLSPALDRPEPSQVAIADDDLPTLLDALDRLEAADVDVRWPSELVAPAVERRLVVSAPAGASASVLDLPSLVSVDWQFLLDGRPLDRDELHAMAEAKRAVVSIRGRWVRIDAHLRRRLLEPPPELDPSDLVAGLLDGEVVLDDGLVDERVDVIAERGADDLVRSLRALGDADGIEPRPAPPGLLAALRPYQERGFGWLVEVCRRLGGGVLADDMGLGKTVQVLALVAERSGPTLVVCPTSLLANWEREAGRFLPGARVRRFHGTRRSLRDLGDADIVLTTYGVVRSDTDALAAVEWDLVVADEAQAIKNPRSRTARCLRGIDAAARIALTGTPVENRLTELWSILQWAVPGLLPNLESFRRDLALPIERDADPVATRRLRHLVGPVLLRRRKTDPGIAPELPPKIERDVVVPLTDEQITLYRAVTQETLADIADHDGLVRHGLVLKLLTALKQITNHPAHHLDETGPLAGRSGKLEALDDLVDRADADGEPMLVFTQYVRMGELLCAHLGSRGVTVEMLHGGLDVGARSALVDRFQARDLPVLVLSLRAGGTGLNLTAARQVVHFDRWWNPAVEDQATDRAHRIGQTGTVTVHRLITEGTVEDRVAELLESKRDLADRVVGGGEGWIGSLDDAELHRLVTLDLPGGHG